MLKLGKFTKIALCLKIRKTSNSNEKIILLFNNKYFHTLNNRVFSILSKKDFDLILEKPEETKKQEELENKEENKTENNEVNKTQETIESKEDNELSADFKRKKQRNNEVNSYSLYRTVDEDRDKEFVDAKYEKESTPFPNWMLQFYRAVIPVIILFVLYGFIKSRATDSSSLEERYSTLEKKRREREAVARTLADTDIGEINNKRGVFDTLVTKVQKKD
ncbi:hypothetical protein ABK040_009377 [Willaertia magna]